MEMTYGIDVSEHNGLIDWQMVKRSGIQFAFIRATCGLIVDKQYKRNAELAIMAGIETGTYGYYYPLLDPAAQAHLLCDTILPYPHTILPAGDLEQPDSKYTRAQKLTRWNLYMDTLDARQHARCWDYISAGFWLTNMTYGTYTKYTSTNELKRMDAPLWEPAYRQGFPDPFFPRFRWDIQQYTSNGYIPGILTRVDLNRSFLTPKEICMKGRFSNA